MSTWCEEDQSQGQSTSSCMYHGELVKEEYSMIFLG